MVVTVTLDPKGGRQVFDASEAFFSLGTTPIPGQSRVNG